MRRTGTPGQRYQGPAVQAQENASRTARRVIAPGQPPRAHELPGATPGGILPSQSAAARQFNNPGVKPPAPPRYQGEAGIPGLPGRPVVSHGITRTARGNARRKA